MKTIGLTCKLLMSLKLDMVRAYGRVEWSLVEAILLKLGFATLWFSVVMKCSTISYSILINANPLDLLILLEV